MTKTISFEVDVDTFHMIEDLARKNGWAPKHYATIALIEKMLLEKNEDQNA